ncbi:MAG: hypothetical protein HWE22_15965 [Flavobacteriales bacterium]|nr:hypothetical protein [Flavobacteriales bacterium]
MKELEFDENGFLIPYDIIEVSFSCFQNEFIQKVNSNKRLELFQDFSHFLEFTSRFISQDFKLWIGGSFVTKKENPSDVDVLLFLNQVEFDNHQSNGNLEFLHRASKSMFNVDLYILPVLSSQDEEYISIQNSIENWKKRFIQYSPNVPKRGFVSIVFNNNTK